VAPNGDRLKVFRSEWMHKWYYNWQTEELTQAFKDASQSANWPPGGENQLFSAMKIFGYTVMRFDEFNHKDDWKWP
jgi:hypothetical protein